MEIIKNMSKKEFLNFKKNNSNFFNSSENEGKIFYNFLDFKKEVKISLNQENLIKNYVIYFNNIEEELTIDDFIKLKLLFLFFKKSKKDELNYVKTNGKEFKKFLKNYPYFNLFGGLRLSKYKKKKILEFSNKKKDIGLGKYRFSEVGNRLMKGL